ncbi:hypothetical protein ACS72_16035 [Acinetobacter sp. VT 511]|uniref:TonB-dependent receptor domain-containing protein n=1 Tax=Acinetobacter sp. VT 511 TaxID=1675902 RepID=UPI0006622341|nr:hypothetical protein ACS72_16035 [Acinetobacter sp. VT 511]
MKLAYKLSNKLLIYGSYDHGYKSGGYNLDQATFDSVLLGGNGPQGRDLRFGAETNDAFEIGTKFSPNRAFSLNIAAFYMNFYNLQSLVFSGNNFVVGAGNRAAIRLSFHMTVRYRTTGYYSEKKS